MSCSMVAYSSTPKGLLNPAEWDFVVDKKANPKNTHIAIMMGGCS